MDIQVEILTNKASMKLNQLWVVLFIKFLCTMQLYENKAFVRTRKLRQLTMVQIVLEQLSFRDLLYLQTDPASKFSIFLNINKPN